MAVCGNLFQGTGQPNAETYFNTEESRNDRDYKRHHHRRYPGHRPPDRAHLPVHRHALPGLPQQPGRDRGRGLRRSRRGCGEAAGGRQHRGEQVNDTNSQGLIDLSYESLIGFSRPQRREGCSGETGAESPPGGHRRAGPGGLRMPGGYRDGPWLCPRLSAAGGTHPAGGCRRYQCASSGPRTPYRGAVRRGGKAGLPAGGRPVCPGARGGGGGCYRRNGGRRHYGNSGRRALEPGRTPVAPPAHEQGGGSARMAPGGRLQRSRRAAGPGQGGAVPHPHRPWRGDAGCQRGAGLGRHRAGGGPVMGALSGGQTPAAETRGGRSGESPGPRHGGEAGTAAGRHRPAGRMEGGGGCPRYMISNRRCMRWRPRRWRRSGTTWACWREARTGRSGACWWPWTSQSPWWKRQSAWGRTSSCPTIPSSSTR